MENIGGIIDLMTTAKKFRKTVVYRIEHDFTKAEYDKWLAQITLWISETQTNTENPREKGRQILDAAINGRKLNGELWAGVDDYDLPSRIRQFCGWDIILPKYCLPDIGILEFSTKTLTISPA